MGCKVKQIETHYSHVVSKQRRQQITKTNTKKNRAVDTGQGAAMQNDSFMAEAMRRYKAGELSLCRASACITRKFKPPSVAAH
jgi:hypothetical protein